MAAWDNDPVLSRASAGAWEADPVLESAPRKEFANGPLKIGADAFPDALREVLRNTDWGTRNIVGAGSALVSGLEGLGVGSPFVNALNATKNFFTGGSLPTNTKRDQNIFEQKIIADEAPIGNIAGNVAMLAPTAFIPGANTVAGAGAIGAVQGALLTPGDIVERAKAAGFGLGGGALGAGLSKAMQATRPITANQNAGVLAQEGITLTPGQNAGGFMKNLEDRATSIPYVGNVIDAARRRGLEDFNRAAIRRVTDPMEQAGMPLNVQGIGNDAIGDIRRGLGSAYDNALSTASVDALEPQFVQKMASLRSMVSALPKQHQDYFDSVIDREIASRMAPNGRINAENLQAVKSMLGEKAANLSSSADAWQRDLGQALKQADAEFRGLVARANPQKAADLKAIDTAYANFKRLQKAASSVAADEGVFTPAQLHNAVKAADKTKDKRAFSEGRALMQDLSAPAKAELPSKINNSGTADRAAMSNIFTQVGGLAGAVPAYLAYSRPGSMAINAAVNRGVKPTAESIRSLLGNNADLLRLLGMSEAKLMGN